MGVAGGALGRHSPPREQPFRHLLSTLCETWVLSGYSNGSSVAQRLHKEVRNYGEVSEDIM